MLTILVLAALAVAVLAVAFARADERLRAALATHDLPPPADDAITEQLRAAGRDPAAADRIPAAHHAAPRKQAIPPRRNGDPRP